MMTAVGIKGVALRLTVLSFLQFAIWGAYLTSMGIYLFKVGMGSSVGWFFSIQGVASIFMPAIVGAVADRWVSAQKVLAFCHFMAALFMSATGYVGMTMGEQVTFGELFVPYMLAVSFFMPTIALSNSVSYTVLGMNGRDPVRIFPRIRVFGTVGFIVSMWIIDLLGFKDSYNQFFASAAWGFVMALYALTMPDCPPERSQGKSKLFSIFGRDAFACMADRRMALFFLFAMLLGCALQISNGYAGVYLSSFSANPVYADTFAVRYPIIMTSLSQISETMCILLIPFFLGRFGIKRVMVIAMIAWALRFYFLAVGNPGTGVWLLVLSMVVYGVAFDFFNISGSLFVNRTVDAASRSSAQGVFMLMTNGIGASIGMVVAQQVVDYSLSRSGWSMAWYIFAAYAVVVAVLFALFFNENKVAK